MVKTRKIKQRGGVNKARFYQALQKGADFAAEHAAPAIELASKHPISTAVGAGGLALTYSPFRRWLYEKFLRTKNSLKRRLYTQATNETTGNIQNTAINQKLEELLNRWMKTQENENQILTACLRYGDVFSNFSPYSHSKEIRKYFVLDTNHDFKFFSSPRWERAVFNTTNKSMRQVDIDTNLAKSIAEYFGGHNSSGPDFSANEKKNYNVYICLDAVPIPLGFDESKLGKFNTPIRWWDGGADSEVLRIINSIPTSIVTSAPISSDTNSSRICSILKNCIRYIPFIGIVYNKDEQISQNNLHDDNISNLDLGSTSFQGTGTRESSIQTNWQSISTAGLKNVNERDLDWTIKNKFINIHNFKLPLLEYTNPSSPKNLRYKLSLDLRGNDFNLILTFDNPLKEITILLNRNPTTPSVNCVSLTQVTNMYYAVTEYYYYFKDKTSLMPLNGFINAMSQSPENSKNDYWDIKKSLSQIADFFSHIILNNSWGNVGQQNYDTQMLLIFFLFNLKRSGDIGQIEAVKLFQTSRYWNREFVYLTLDSFAATIARDVYDVNVGLLSADKKSYILCRRTGWREPSVPIIENNYGVTGASAQPAHSVSKRRGQSPKLTSSEKQTLRGIESNMINGVIKNGKNN
jgi:hypothetical protein